MTQAVRKSFIEQKAALSPAVAERRVVRRMERVVGQCDRIIDIVAALFNVSGRELREQGRCSNPVARVRHIAMYVAHVVLGLTMKEVGAGFGRDRTTVMHACHTVEDLRDDTEFDRIVLLAEKIAAAALCDREDA